MTFEEHATWRGRRPCASGIRAREGSDSKKEEKAEKEEVIMWVKRDSWRRWDAIVEGRFFVEEVLEREREGLMCWLLRFCRLLLMESMERRL